MFVIKILEAASGEPTSAAGLFVSLFDPNAANGRGYLETTRLRKNAKRYKSKESAFSQWRSSSLKAFTVSIEPAEGADAEAPSEALTAILGALRAGKR